MLRKIRISNYALIDELSIEFTNGLTIITGETGAGKSILLGAMQLLLGERADTGVLRESGRKCIVEGTFSTDGFDLSDFFEDNNLDFEQACIVRREINPAGKSRAFINDTPVNLAQLKGLAAQLIDIHSQHDSLLLETVQFQTRILDAFAGSQHLFAQYNQAYQQWKTEKKLLEALKQEEARSAAEHDFLQFQYQELADMQLQANESVLLEEEFNLLEHSTEILKQVGRAEALLDGEQESILTNLRQLVQVLGPVGAYTRNGTEIIERVRAAGIELRDLLGELQLLRENTATDPQRHETVIARLDRINHLLGKHRLQSSDELLQLQHQLSERLQNQSLQGESIRQKEISTEALFQLLLQLASALHKKRVEASSDFCKQVKNLLKKLGMPDAMLEVKIGALEEPAQGGMDQITFLFSANKGSGAKEIQKVASGGELSRLMLVLKKLVARSIALPTIIFDEIDTGVSGLLADAMGEILKEMANDMQVIVITHLPQIASKANEHLKVVKTTKLGATFTDVIRLEPKERVSEIAGMLSGRELSGEAISNAEILLGIRKK
ncbi:MAG: DNA repair protein RecN [Bacteroidia bacterium]|nr:DNA repair protein RecN [Bacteroidia bacterium]MCC6767773.1 DNA repair protein RecN [Bacteroidia bacterium]